MKYEILTYLLLSFTSCFGQEANHIATIEYTNIQQIKPSKDLSIVETGYAMLAAWLDNVKIEEQEIISQEGYWKNYNFNQEDKQVAELLGLSTSEINSGLGQHPLMEQIDGYLSSGPFMLQSSNKKEVAIVNGLSKGGEEAILKFTLISLSGETEKKEMTLSQFSELMDKNKLLSAACFVNEENKQGMSANNCSGVDKSPGGITAAYATQRNEERANRKCRIEKYLLKTKLYKNLEGVIYFDDNKLTVKGSQLLKGKKKVGSLVLEKDKAKKKILITYSYKDEKGDTLSGNLLDGTFATKNRDLTDGMFALPGEGSALKITKKEWIGFGIGGWTTIKAVKKGFAKYGGEYAKEVLHPFIEQIVDSIKLDSKYIKTLINISEVESKKRISAINSHDGHVMSVGFVQFTLLEKLQLWIKASKEDFKRFGIEVTSQKVTNKAFKNIKTIKGVANRKSSYEMRNIFWSLRFYDAALDPENIKSQMLLEIKNLKKRVDPKLSKNLHKKYFNHIGLYSMFAELRNNRPAIFSKTVAYISTQKVKKGEYSLKEFTEILQMKMRNAYIELEPICNCYKIEKILPDRASASLNWENKYKKKYKKKLSQEKIQENIDKIKICLENFDKLVELKKKNGSSEPRTYEKADSIIKKIKKKYSDLN